jgi:hypothetical protein
MSKSKTLTSNAAPEIRSIFSSNLRQLCDNYGPISQLSSDLGSIEHNLTGIFQEIAFPDQMSYLEFAIFLD